LLRPQTADERAQAAEVYAPAKRLQEGEHAAVVVGNPGETIWLDLAGSGEAGEIAVVTKSAVIRAPYPVGSWKSRLEIRPDGTFSTVSGTTIEPAGSTQGAPVTPAAASSPPGLIGGGCAYRDVPGMATILRVRKTAESRHQAEVGGGPGYEGLEASFVFAPDEPLAEEAALAFLSRQHVLLLTNSWYPGQAFLRKYEIAQGRKIPAVLRVRTAGPCTPFGFAFPGIDLSDYFESR
jgi:hypothetical protein